MAEQKKEMTRREFLAKSGTVGAGLTLGMALPAAAAAPAKGERKVPTVILGRTGQRVSRLGFGGSWDVEPVVLMAGVERGIDYFDTAESYTSGQSERAMGQFIHESCKRSAVYVVTKTTRYHDLENRLAGSLQRLQMDHVDTLYLHDVHDPEVLASPDVKAAAERLKKAGKIRFFGFSCHHTPALVECLERGPALGHFDVIMFRYSFRDRDNADLNRALDKCAKANLGLVAMKTLASSVNVPPKYDVFLKQGLNRTQAALKAIWADHRIHAIVSEMVNVDHVTMNTAAAAMKLTRAEDAALGRYAAATDHLYCRGCEHFCRTAAGSTVAVADILRFRLYHDHYGKKERARLLYAQLPDEAKDLEGGDWERGESACPHGLPLRRLLEETARKLG